MEKACHQKALEKTGWGQLTQGVSALPVMGNSFKNEPNMTKWLAVFILGGSLRRSIIVGMMVFQFQEQLW